MPKFTYKAKSRDGKIKTGSVKAPSKTRAKEMVLNLNLSLLSLQSEKESNTLSPDETPIIGDWVFKDADGNIQIAITSSKPNAKDLIIFTKQFATMLNSGVPMIQAIGILGKQQPSREFTQALFNIERTVENGSTFSDALKQFPGIFDNLYVAMVEAGEASGNLDVILNKLVGYIERTDKIKGQVKSAMMYPIIVVFVAIIVVSALLAFVVPVFAQQFQDSGRELPQLTQIVIDFSNFFAENYTYIFLSLFLSVVGFRSLLKTEKGKSIFDKWILKAPGIGPLLKKIAVGRFCSTMSSMLTSGVNLLEALNICAASSGNKTIEDFVLGVRSGLEKGTTFSEPLSEGGLFPDMVISMVSVGEQTGALDDMLLKVSEFYEDEVDLAIATMLSMIEPIMIVLIGGIIAFIVIAMYLPVFDLAGGIS